MHTSVRADMRCSETLKTVSADAPTARARRRCGAKPDCPNPSAQYTTHGKQGESQRLCVVHNTRAPTRRCGVIGTMESSQRRSECPCAVSFYKSQLIPRAVICKKNGEVQRELEDCKTDHPRAKEKVATHFISRAWPLHSLLLG